MKALTIFANGKSLILLVLLTLLGCTPDKPDKNPEPPPTPPVLSVKFEGASPITYDGTSTTPVAISTISYTTTGSPVSVTMEGKSPVRNGYFETDTLVATKSFKITAVDATGKTVEAIATVPVNISTQVTSICKKWKNTYREVWNPSNSQWEESVIPDREKSYVTVYYPYGRARRFDDNTLLVKNQEGYWKLNTTKDSIVNWGPTKPLPPVSGSQWVATFSSAGILWRFTYIATE